MRKTSGSQRPFEPVSADMWPATNGWRADEASGCSAGCSASYSDVAKRNDAKPQSFWLAMDRAAGEACVRRFFAVHPNDLLAHCNNKDPAPERAVHHALVAFCTAFAAFVNPNADYEIRDTSACRVLRKTAAANSGGAGGAGLLRPDCSLVLRGQATAPAHLVTVADFKKLAPLRQGSFAAKDLGQLQAYAACILAAQRHRRSVVAFLLDPEHVQFVRAERRAAGSLAYFQTAVERVCYTGSPVAEGLLQLYAFFSAPVSDLGYAPLHNPISVVGLGEFLGQGASSLVYAAHGREDCVVKLLDDEKAAEAEASTLRALGSVPELENVPRLLLHSGRGLLLSPRAQPLPRGALRARHVLQALEALRRAHAAGWVHRDVRPANLLWVPDEDSALLNDWGYAAKPRATAAPYHGTLSMASDAVLTQLAADPKRVASRPADDLVSLVRTVFVILFPRFAPAVRDPALLLAHWSGMPSHWKSAQREAVRCAYDSLRSFFTALLP